MGMGYFQVRTVDRLRNIYSVIVEYTGTRETLLSLPISVSKLIWQYNNTRTFSTRVFSKRKRPLFFLDIEETEKISKELVKDKHTALYELDDLLADGIYIEFKDRKEQELFILEAPHVLNRWAALHRV
ncbi:hypothetical protein [Domibacillus robiginosus]|uniref:hypothetical protein n=1 Tax=Domibacillus robiginosus TaxID=1071054 RepID=UPI00067B8947|nr:hypothetical protein [Domibacillus robiginosus]